MNNGLKVELDYNNIKEIFFIKSFKMNDLYSQISDKSPISFKNLNDIYGQCTNFIQPNKFIGSDKFTNAVLIGYILDVVAPNGVIKTYTATACEKNKIGVLVLEYLNGHSFNTYINNNELKDLDIITLLQQTKLILDNLWNVAQFNHNNLTTSSLAIFEQGGGFIVKLGDFENASITVNTGNNYLRLYNYSSSSNLLFNLTSFKPNVYKDDNNNIYYILNDTFNLTDLAKIRNSGIPFYKSFDFYTLIISLLMNPKINNIFLSSNLLRNILNRIFYIGDISYIYNDVNKAISSKKTSYADIVNILKNKRLYCNINI